MTLRSCFTFPGLNFLLQEKAKWSFCASQRGVHMRCFGNLQIKTSRGEWEIQLRTRKRAWGCSSLPESHQWRLKDSYEVTSSLGFIGPYPWVWFPGFLIGKPGAETSHSISLQSNATEMQSETTGDTPRNQTHNFFSQKLFLYLLAWFPFCARVIKQLFLSFTWNLFIQPPGTSL